MTLHASGRAHCPMMIPADCSVYDYTCIVPVIAVTSCSYCPTSSNDLMMRAIGTSRYSFQLLPRRLVTNL